MKKNLIILVGIPGSGKSTWAKEFVTEYNACHISRDVIRFSFLKDNEDYFAHEGKVFSTFINTINEKLADDSYDYVIADATHINEGSRNKLLSNINNLDNVNCIFVVFRTSLKTCLARNLARETKYVVPTSAIINMSKKLTDPANDILHKSTHVLYVDEDAKREWLNNE